MRGRVGALALAAVVATACGGGGARHGEGFDVAAALTTTTAAAPTSSDTAGDLPPRGDDRSATVSERVGGTTPAAVGRGERPATPGGPAAATRTADAAGNRTRATIPVGLHYSANLDAAYAALGASDAEGDIRPRLEALVGWINDTGGLGGRRVEPVFHGTNPLDGSFDGQAQVACADFTEDHRVAVVVSGAVLPSFTLPECLAQRRTPIVWNYQYLLDRTMLDRYADYLYQPIGISAERLAPVLVDELRAAGWLTGARVGLVRYDLPQHERFADRMIEPRLRSAGAPVVAEVALRPPPTAAAASDTASQISSAILRFRSAGVTHVLFVPTGGAVPFLFTANAEAQGFRPRYALTSLDVPSFVNDQASPAQLRRSVAIGWTPSSDVYRQDEPPSAERARCYAVTDSRLSIRYCDALLLLRAALERDPRGDPASLRAAIESLGATHRPAMSFATTFGRGRHDGASAVRLIRYDDSCECFRYAPGSPVRSIG